MKYYIVNTNRKADPGGYDEQTMLKEEIVALYFHGHKECIDDLVDGDIIFFYSNGQGVIGCGEVYGSTHKRNYKGLRKFKDEEFYKNLKSVTKTNLPITVKEMTKLFGKRPLVSKSIAPLSKQQGEILFKTIVPNKRYLKVA